MTILITQNWFVHDDVFLFAFKVCEMKQEDIADWKEHLAEKYILNEKDTEGNVFKVPLICNDINLKKNHEWGQKFQQATSMVY